MRMLCLDFFESDWRDFRGRWLRECLREPEWIGQFLDRWNLHVAVPPNEPTLLVLIELRSLMRRVVECLPDKQPADDDLDALNALIEKAPSVSLLTWNGAYHLELKPHRQDWDLVMAKIAISFADLLVNYDLKRLKICENPYCSGIFYDQTKSRTRRWCTNSKCGNLWKLRRFRERHRV